MSLGVQWVGSDCCGGALVEWHEGRDLGIGVVLECNAITCVHLIIVLVPGSPK